MKLYSCDFEGCTATTEKLRSGWKMVDYGYLLDWWMAILWAIPFFGAFVSAAYLGVMVGGEFPVAHLCPEHAKRIKGLVRTGG